MSETGAWKELMGVIQGYLRSRARTYHSTVLVKVLSSVKGDNLVGCKVLFTDTHGNRYTGRVIGAHGSKGDIVKVRFKPNLPGQALNSMVVIRCREESSNV